MQAVEWMLYWELEYWVLMWSGHCWLEVHNDMELASVLVTPLGC